MKKILLAIILLVNLLQFTSCADYDDIALWNKSNDMDVRLKTVEELCSKMNSNIISLQIIVNALQTNDYIKSITPITDPSGKIAGYTIDFSISGAITIYHGKDGKDGIDGTSGGNGTTPDISVKQDTDGFYYWTLNGEWLTDQAGNKVRAQGIDGKDGHYRFVALENGNA